MRSFTSKVARQQLRRHLFQVPISSASPPRVDVLYQSLGPPIIDGIQKPKKPGGTSLIQSSCSLAWLPSLPPGIEIVCPSDDLEPKQHVGWSFPDTEDGAVEAVEKGAAHMWANTILFATHPLQLSKRLAEYQDRIRIVGQGPLVADKYDGKECANDLLRKLDGFTLPRWWSIHDNPNIDRNLQELVLTFPVVAKPIRGRGSHGVRVCRDLQDLTQHTQALCNESPSILLEEFLAGQEATVTVMPPVSGKGKYWALPVVARFNHVDGVAPYNGVVAVTANARAITSAESNEAAQELSVTAPIRIDV
ncbi:hypothetical protein F66182_27 [Fusarium sp. NRRL 66182]|nr:hypothetical protein F66182_27 [Fusarium sp. NRRL 66182]